MVILYIDNSESRVQGLSEKQLTALRFLMTYSISAQANYFSGSFKSPKRHLMDVKGRFPTGLLYIAIEYLSDSAIYYTTNDLRIRPRRPSQDIFSLSLDHNPYPAQLEAAWACRERSRGIISAPTGSGKSLIITLIINELQVPTLVIVPSLELKRQLTETLTKAFGSDKVGKRKLIWVENIDSLSCTQVLEGYDCVIIDEFHHSGAKTYRKLNKKALTRTYYRFGLTATPFRSQDNERLLLESVLSEVIYKIDYQDSVANKHIVPLEAYYIELPKTNPKGQTWAQIYSELVVNNYERNLAITKLLIKLHVNKLSTLCLVKEIKHGEILANDGAFKLVTGQNDERSLINLFSNGELSTLIGTTGVIGEGVDTRACEYVIIAGLGKSKNSFMQSCGRAFRNFIGKESGKVILIKDFSHRWTANHFRMQVKYLKEEYGVIPLRLEL